MGKNPEVHSFEEGKTVCRFSLATSKKYKNKDGEKVEQTEWHSIVSWRHPLNQILEKYVTKGSKLMIEGEISTRSFEDSDGNKKYVTEIITNQVEFLGGNKAEPQSAGQPTLEEDDLPF